MATTPSSLVIFTEDKINFPIKVAMVIMKQLFQYGVRDISTKQGNFFINLTYSPRTGTLKRKFGNLPVRYMRVKIQTDEEFKMLEKVVKRYKFNLLDEQPEDLDRKRIEVSPGPSDAGNRKYYLEPPQLLWSDGDDDSEEDVVSPKNKKLKTGEQNQQQQEQSLEEINIEDDELTSVTVNDTSNINQYLSQKNFFLNK
ncbi:unnamed protein product [Psylliodes chrysocephalus]|uniref:Uncharacterized protein n=1 Tax=Psylliodes chrysocephalus TaxID=3402493 RepID=A0A9P0CRQ7_9CUCU|nr:unnamed protein product [Psylliodes chrysocephala]CAH1106816.1 unnamed protein product [Psylliodes chrysocephala]